MNFNNVNQQTETELNVKGVEFALNETLNKMGLVAKYADITPEKVDYEVYTMENYVFIGGISLINSEACP